MNTGSEHIHVEKRKEVGIITLKKSDGLNIFDSTMLHDLGDFLNELGKDETIRVLIITGIKNFSAGANIKEMKEFNPVGCELALACDIRIVKCGCEIRSA